MANNWLLNNDKQSEFEINGSKVTFKYEPNCSNYYNAMYLPLCANEKKQYYWEFDCSASCSVGIAKKSSFADGYKISGCFFNGNLSDGSCLLIGEFGDMVKQGHKIGFIIDRTGSELKIYVVQNGRPLGLAFVHQEPFSNELHPCVCFTQPGSVEISEKEANNLENLLIRTDYQNKTIDGKYKLVKTIEKQNEKKLPEYILSLRGDDKNNEQLHISIHVINTIGGILTKTGKDEEGDIYNVEGLMSTLMAGDPEQMQDEFYLSSIIHTLKRVKFNENLDEFTIVAPDAQLHFKRFLPEKEPHRTESLLR